MQWRTYPATVGIFYVVGKFFSSSLIGKLENSPILAMACGLRIKRRHLQNRAVVNLELTTKKIDCSYFDVVQVLFPLLSGRVFHVTTEEKFNDICRSGWIYSKEQTQFVLTPGQSETTYGRKQGWVSLYDLSYTEHTDIKEALIRYWFFRTLRAGRTDVYLMIAKSAWPSLVSWKSAGRDMGGQEFFIPFGIPATFRLSSLTKALWLVFIHPPAKLSEDKNLTVPTAPVLTAEAVPFADLFFDDKMSTCHPPCACCCHHEQQVD